MKKKLLVVCMAFTMMFSFTACGKQETTETEAATEAGVTVGAEVEQFINRDLPSISSERDKAVRLYKAYFDSAEEKIQQSEEALSAYKSSLRSVCESNGITINGDIGEATSTDAE